MLLFTLFSYKVSVIYTHFFLLLSIHFSIYIFQTFFIYVKQKIYNEQLSIRTQLQMYTINLNLKGHTYKNYHISSIVNRAHTLFNIGFGYLKNICKR